ncbi:DUF4254 domain-containing protein [Nocardia macrotermitis]|uniref:DUF4254 domain-containing protein n=1 Tax=Nocardia macrotermitis TaxID=2585198 RepID=A0A7K0CXH4_9NOCA|nr:DUF4254 domain-containing protein [Nocardia macrotermitis]MQY18197.1 hypothetical protein [Nocardia macrotermitis]
MRVTLPSRDRLLEACTGSTPITHPVLRAARDLAHLHRQRREATTEIHEIDCARADLIHTIDCWVAANMPQPFGAAYMNSESVGMIIDRIAQYCIEAHTTLTESTTEPDRHFLWQRLAELTLAYTDLAIELTAGLRKLPSCTYRHPTTSGRAP